MKLFGSYTSPYVRHCRIAMLQEGFDFELIETDNATSAKQSPTAKIPFFTDGDLFLTDSSSITKYVREKTGKIFLSDVKDYDSYALVNTLMDTAINIFLLERSDNITHENSEYLKRQNHRIASGLTELNDLVKDPYDMENDFLIRAACFLDWGQYRKRFDFSGHVNLLKLLKAANKDENFVHTAPPEK